MVVKETWSTIWKGLSKQDQYRILEALLGESRGSIKHAKLIYETHEEMTFEILFDDGLYRHVSTLKNIEWQIKMLDNLKELESELRSEEREEYEAWLPNEE